MLNFSRVIIVGPTRSTCSNITKTISTSNIPIPLLIEKHREEIDGAVDSLHLGGFGIMAGTGTGKTVSIRHIAKRVLKIAGNVPEEDIRIDIVTREHERTEHTDTCNVLVITSGIAKNWLLNGYITKRDLIILDEVHQTSAHLELSMALAKREGCTFIWMSATVDSFVYEEYLNSRTVIRCDDFDPSRKAKVEFSGASCLEFVASHLARWKAEQRGVIVFVSTRKMAENLSTTFEEEPGVYVDHYHGGRNIATMEKILSGNIPKPFIFFMTPVGSSSLNVDGLDRIVLEDELYHEIVGKDGRGILQKGYLGPNEILQAGGRVNGRALDGRIYILSDREFDFHSLKPVSPRFILGSDLVQVALTCARLGINVSELDFIKPINTRVYEREAWSLVGAGIINEDGLLSSYGEEVEQVPVDPEWAEIILHARDMRDENLLRLVVITAGIKSLHDLLKDPDDYPSRFKILGSDHLTAHNIVAHAARYFASIVMDEKGIEVYRFGPDFEKWCEKNKFNEKAIMDAVMAVKSVYYQLKIPMPKVEDFKPVSQKSRLKEMFTDLLAEVQSLDLIHDGKSGLLKGARRSKCSMIQTEIVLGKVRCFNFGTGQVYIYEGTDIPYSLARRYKLIKSAPQTQKERHQKRGERPQERNKGSRRDQRRKRK